MFIDKNTETYRLATFGLPLFAAGFIPFAFNIITVGYYQSVEKIIYASVVTVLRGSIIMILSFILLPIVLGIEGVWLAIPVTEIISAFISLFFIWQGRNTIMVLKKY